MKTIITTAVGVWIGSRIYKTLADNKAKETEINLKTGLKRFIAEYLPGKFKGKALNAEIEKIIKGK